MPLRHRFPIFQEKIYINSCSQGALSHDVRQSYSDYLSDWEEFGSPWELWVEKLEQTRAAFARLVRANADNIAVTTSVSAAISAIASGLRFDDDRNRIVITDFAFPTSAQIWYAQELRGAQVVRIPEKDDWIEADRIVEAIDDRTRIVSLPAVCYRNGARLELDPVVRAARQHGALVLLDAYQALGTYPLYVEDLDIDFLVGGALKYLLASAGLAFAYVRPQLLSSLSPTITGWFAQENIFAMHVDRYAPSPTARMLESGTPPVPNLYAGIAGMAILEEIGLESIHAHIATLTETLKSGIRDRGLALVSPDQPAHHGAMTTVRAVDVEQLVTKLAEENIIASSRDDNLRISPHFYNNADDITTLLAALDKYHHLLAPVGQRTLHAS